jgi:hypothetical protein
MMKMKRPRSRKKSKDNRSMSQDKISAALNGGVSSNIFNQKPSVAM